MAGSTIPAWDEAPKAVEGPGPTYVAPPTALAQSLFGHPVAEGLEKVATVLDAKRRQADTLAAGDLDNQAAVEIASVVKAQSLLESKSALDTARFHEAIAAIKDRYLQAAQEGDQRTQLERLLLPRVGSAQVALEAHAGQQAKVYRENVVATGFTEAGQRLMENPNQPGAVEAEWAGLVPKILALAEDKGATEEGKQQMLRGALGGLMEKRIRGYLAHENGGAAREVFEHAREYLYEIDHKAATALEHEINEKWGKEKALAVATEGLGIKMPGNPMLVNLGAGMAKLEARAVEEHLNPVEVIQAKEYFKANALFAHQAFEQKLQSMADTARQQYEQGNPALKIPPYSNPELAVDPAVKRWLQDKNNPGGPVAWEQLMGWYQTYQNRERVNANLPSNAQRVRFGQIGLMLVQEPEIAQRLPYATFAAQFVNGVDAQTGEPLVTPAQADELKREFLARAQHQADQKPTRIVSDKDILLDELQVQRWIPTARARTGEKLRDPDTWQKPTTHFAAWEYFAGDLAKWRAQNPDAKDDDVRKYVRERMSAEKERQYRERKGWFPSTIYGFELERRRNEKGEPAYREADFAPVLAAPPAAIVQPKGGWKPANSIAEVPPEVVKAIRAERPKITDTDLVKAHNLNLSKGIYGKGE